MAFLIYHIRYRSAYLPAARLVLGTTRPSALLHTYGKSHFTPVPKWQYPTFFPYLGYSWQAENFRARNPTKIVPLGFRYNMTTSATSLPSLTLSNVGGHVIAHCTQNSSRMSSPCHPTTGSNECTRQAENGTPHRVELWRVSRGCDAIQWYFRYVFCLAYLDVVY